MSSGGEEAGGRAASGGDDRRALIDGRFEVQGRLREGLLGPVYRVRDHELAVAPGRAAELEIVRAIDPETPELDALLRGYVDDFGRLEHPGVLAPYATGRTELGLPYLATGRVEGTTVAAMLEQGRLLGVDKVFAIARELLDALADAHANGLVHGTIDARRVVLEEARDSRPPGVRLLDFGRRGLLAPPEGQPRPEHDLFDVATLLVQMLTGELVEVAVSTPSAWRARAEALRVPEARREVLLRALADDPATRFPDATSFRRALDEPRRAAPLSERTLLLAAAVLAALGGVLLGRLTAPTVVAAAPGEPDAAELERARAVEERLRADVALLEEGLNRAEAEREAAVARTYELAQEREALRGEVTDREQEAQRAAGERDELAAANERLRGELDAARASLRDLERTRAQVDVGFDVRRFVELVEAHDGAGALRLVRASRLGAEEKAALAALAEAAGALGRARAAVDDVGRAEELLRARESLSGASEPILAAAVDGAVLAGARAVLVAEHERESAALTPRIETWWRTALERALQREPRPVVIAGRWFGDGRLGEFLDRYADGLRELAGQGALDPARLASVTTLEAWAGAIDEDERLRAFGASAEVLRFRWALRFLTDRSELSPGVEPGELRADRVAPAWDADLALRARLLATDSRFPAPRRGRLAFRTRTPEGLVSWQIEDYRPDPEPPLDATRSWAVTRYTFDAEGRALGDGRSFRVVQVEKRFFEEGARRALLVDLGDARLAARAEAFAPRYEGSLPARLPLDAAGRAAVLERAGADALVCATDDGEAWFVPRLGPVLRDRPGRLTRELVFVEGE